MKTLIVYYSLTGKTKTLAEYMAKNIDANLVELEEISILSKIGAFTKGVFMSIFRRPSYTMPINEDISIYQRVVIASPIWAGFPSPAIYDFISKYALNDKEIYGLLSCSGSPKNANKLFRQELKKLKLDCKSVLTIKTDNGLMDALKNNTVKFSLDCNDKIIMTRNTHNDLDKSVENIDFNSDNNI